MRSGVRAHEKEVDGEARSASKRPKNGCPGSRWGRSAASKRSACENGVPRAAALQEASENDQLFSSHGPNLIILCLSDQLSQDLHRGPSRSNPAEGQVRMERTVLPRIAIIRQLLLQALVKASERISSLANTDPQRARAIAIGKGARTAAFPAPAPRTKRRLHRDVNPGRNARP